MTTNELEVRDSIPVELNNRYFRNDANPITGESAHWLLGDGMIHGVRLLGAEPTGFAKGG